MNALHISKNRYGANAPCRSKGTELLCEYLSWQKTYGTGSMFLTPLTDLAKANGETEHRLKIS